MIQREHCSTFLSIWSIHMDLGQWPCTSQVLTYFCQVLTETLALHYLSNPTSHPYLCWPYSTRISSVFSVCKHCWAMFRRVPYKCDISLSSPFSTSTWQWRQGQLRRTGCWKSFKMGISPIQVHANSLQVLWHQVFDCKWTLALPSWAFAIMEVFVFLNEDGGQFTWMGPPRKWKYIGHMTYSVGPTDFE